MGPHFFLEPHLKVVLTALMPHFDMNTSTHTHTDTHAHTHAHTHTHIRVKVIKWGDHPIFLHLGPKFSI